MSANLSASKLWETTIKRIILAALVGVLVSGPAWAQPRKLHPGERILSPGELMLVCKAVAHDDYYLLQPAKGKVRIVDIYPAREGELEVKENVYIMRFPNTKNHNDGSWKNLWVMRPGFSIVLFMDSVRPGRLPPPRTAQPNIS